MRHVMNILIVSAFLALSCTSLQAETRIIEANNSFEQVDAKGFPQGWRLHPGNKKIEGTVIVEENGSSDGQRHLKIQTSGKNWIQLMANESQVVQPWDEFKTTLMVKGKGSVALLYFGYAKDKKFMDKLATPAQTVDSAEWTSLTFESTISAREYEVKERRGSGVIAFIRPVISVNSENGLHVDQLSMSLVKCGDTIAVDSPWSKAKVYKNMSCKPVLDNDQEVIKFSYNKGRHAYATSKWIAPAKSGEGISFEVKGDGSKCYVSFNVSTTTNPRIAYESIFPLASKEWTKVTFRWEDLVLNYSMTNKDIANEKHLEAVLDPRWIQSMSFGIGGSMHKHWPDSFDFDIRNIQVEQKLPKSAVPSFSKGLSHTVKKIKAKESLKVLLLGDSITAMYGKANGNGNLVYAHFLAKELKARHGIDLRFSNQAVGGQTARFGTILLNRSLNAMPNPDLVIMMYGANDCKVTEILDDYNAEVFGQELGRLIDRVRIGTKGQADILLLTGVPRLDKDRQVSIGIVERISDGVFQAAKKHQTGLCDTLSAYHELLKGAPSDWAPLYLDTIHQSQPAGQTFLAKQVLATLEQALREH